MQTLTRYFEELRKAVEPSEDYKRIAQAADDPVREHLEEDESFSEHHLSTFLYGSYRRQTAICEIKDVDLVVVTNFTKKDDPLEVLETLKASLNELYNGADLADQRRSIRVDRPLSDNAKSKLTLDVIPAIYRSGSSGSLWVPDRGKKSWVASHPQGHIDYVTSLNADSHDGQFVRLVKMMKWWWQFQWGRANPGGQSHLRRPKGFWIEVMCGEYVDLKPDNYPELIVRLLTNAQKDFAKYRTTGVAPELPDPGLPRQTIKTSISNAEFGVFLRTLVQALADANSAIAAKTDTEAARYWRRLFGDIFPDATSGSLLKPAASVAAGLSFPAKPLVPTKPAGFAASS